MDFEKEYFNYFEEHKIPNLEKILDITKDGSEKDSAIGSDQHVTFEESTNLKINNLSKQEVYRIRKLTYNVGTHLFNRYPDKGMNYFIKNKIVENKSLKIADFIVRIRPLISPSKIREYFEGKDDIQSHEILNCMIMKMNFKGILIQDAVRILMTYIDIKKLDSEFANRVIHIFCDYYLRSNNFLTFEFQRNPVEIVKAIIWLNHNLPKERLKKINFQREYKKIPIGNAAKSKIFQLISKIEFPILSPENDSYGQNQQVLEKIAPNMLAPHRKFVGYCRFKIIKNKPKKLPKHRSLFLFNDSLIVVKLRDSPIGNQSMKTKDIIHLFGLLVVKEEKTALGSSAGLIRKFDNRIILKFFTEFNEDLINFVGDLKECIAETNMVETLSIEDSLAT